MALSWVPQIEMPPPDAVRAAADLLNAGRRTVLLVGQGALGATAEVEALAARRAAPVTKAFLGKTVIADTSPYSTGGIGEFGTTASSAAMQGCDTLLIAGSTMPWLHYYPKPGQARIVQIRLTVTLVLKNDHYSRIVSEDEVLGIPPFGTELQPIDFVRFAEACGGVGFACAQPEDVRPALEAAWRIADRPALVEATIDNDADVSPPDKYLSRYSA